jgi:hypothetical protein
MAYVFTLTGRVNLADEHGLTASKSFDIWVDDALALTPEARIDIARLKLLQLAGHLDNITDAVVTSVIMSVDVIGSVLNLKATPGEQGVAEGAIVRIYKENKNTLHPYWIPGAVEGVFLSDFATVDVNDADLQTYFEEFNQDVGVEVRFSDGERLDEARGVDGLLDGYYATKQRSAD